MTKKIIEKIVKFCDSVESDINIDEAVAKDYSYEIGTWDIVQRIKEIIGNKIINEQYKNNNKRNVKNEHTTI